MKDLLKPLDLLAREMERQWGPDRLPTLVPHDLALKFANAQQNLNNAIESNQETRIAEKAANLIRGWKLLDQAARKAGHTPEDLENPLVWYFRGDREERYAVVREVRDLAKIPKEKCDRSFTMAELGRILSYYETHEGGHMIEKIKNQFRGSVITKISKTNTPLEEWMPF